MTEIQVKRALWVKEGLDFADNEFSGEGGDQRALRALAHALADEGQSYSLGRLAYVARAAQIWERLGCPDLSTPGPDSST